MKKGVDTNLLFNLKEGCKYKIIYLSNQSGLKKEFDGIFKKQTEYVIETRDYFSGFVLDAKKNELLKDGRSGIYEKLIFPFIYLNINTNKQKLRVPVVGHNVLKYYIKNKVVSEHKYLEELQKVGWRPKSVTYSWNRFQSFDIEKIKSISFVKHH